ncbi:MAG TPA: efflux RND transporter periplasmic adaptor subunit [Azospirillum sp.]|nr:efflux RND transporter periplasmic adaptor subunit [Azospirillum sp.]
MKALLAAGLLLALTAGAAAQAPVLPDFGAVGGPALNREIRAQVTAQRRTVISSAMAGRIRELAVDDGDRFREGQVLVRFDCSVQESQLARGRAVAEKKRRVYDVNQRLHKLGSISTVELDVAAADVAEAAAEIRVLQALVDRCTIAAPFGGRVAANAVRAFQFIGEGQPLLEIVDDKRLETELIVPSRWLGWLTPGHRFQVEIDETGKRYPVELIRTSGRVDPVSQSLKIYGRIDGAADDLLVGMSGRALLAPPDAPR